MSSPADSLDFWQLPKAEARLQEVHPNTVLLEGDLCLQVSLAATSLRRFYLTRSLLTYSVTLI